MYGCESSDESSVESWSGFFTAGMFPFRSGESEERFSRELNDEARLRGTFVSKMFISSNRRGGKTTLPLQILEVTLNERFPGQPSVPSRSVRLWVGKVVERG